MAKYQWKSSIELTADILQRSSSMGVHNASVCILQ